MVNRLNIRDARPGDAPFLTKCILSSMHLYDFETYPSDHMAGILSRLTASETLEDTLYTFRNTRVAELNGTPAGALLSYPGEEYLVRRERTFREFWPEYFSEHADDDPETDPGEWYLDSLAVIPEYRRMGIGKALLKDGIRKGLSQGFNRVALVADPEYPHLVRLYKSLGFAPDGTRHAFGMDFLRMVRRDDGQILSDSLLRYDLGEDVEAFSPERDAVLPYPVTQGHQVHGSRIAVVDRPGMTREELEGYDALMTSLPGVAIGVRTADCVPVLLYDPVKRAVAAVHAGWKGTVLHISEGVIEAMKQEYGTDPSDLRAVIGPSIGPESFQVGEEVAAKFRDAGFPMDDIWSFKGVGDGTPMSGGHHIDLWRANRWLLEEAGVLPGNIRVAGIDTFTTEAFFSARREGIQCGRTVSTIRLT